MPPQRGRDARPSVILSGDGHHGHRARGGRSGPQHVEIGDSGRMKFIVNLSSLGAPAGVDLEW